MIVFFRDAGGKTPFLEWFDALWDEAKVRCRAKLDLLAREGHRLRRPAADYLRDGIFELRARAGRVQYRVLYFFHGPSIVVVSHGIRKRSAGVPPGEIDRARGRKRAFEADP